MRSEDIKDSCSYKFWVVFNLFTLPAYLLVSFVQVIYAVVVLLVGLLIYVFFVLLGHWAALDEEDAKKVWGDDKQHVTYPYKYCPWTGKYLKYAPWQIILPLFLLYVLLAKRAVIYESVIAASSDFGAFLFNHIFLGAISLFLVFYLLFKIWRSEFVKELREDIKRNYCIPVELVRKKTEN